MKSEIEQLIDLYKNKGSYKQQVRELASQAPFPDIAGALNLQDKHRFGKDRQRAELLKNNDIFLKELEAIKNRLGEEFFRMADAIINDNSFSEMYASVSEVISSSAFFDPVIVFDHKEDLGFEGIEHHYYLPNAPLYDDGWPIEEIELPRDPLFGGVPLEWIIVDPLLYADEAQKAGARAFREKCRMKVYENYLANWMSFLDKWHISLNWNGDLQVLHVHSLPSVVVEKDGHNHNLPVVIRLGAWATREDLGNAWPAVEQAMKEAHIYRERESENFLRDQIWYKQNQHLGMTPLKIAREWAKRFPEEVDLEVVEKLTRDEESFMDVPPQEILEEVLSDDPSMAELRGRFVEARKVFISTGLRDRVKKSIQATQKKIKRLGSDEWDRNRERLLKPVLKRQEK